jgi:hypothetical protein
VVELPKPPWYRRFWLLVLAINVVFAAMLVAAVVTLWPRAVQRPASPETAAGEGQQTEPIMPEATEPGPTVLTSTTARLEPGVLWRRRGSLGHVGGLFDAPGRWRISWSFNCRSFAKYGGGNFKLSGDGAFRDVSVQRFGVRGSGTLKVTGGGRGRLVIASVCDRWEVKAAAP